MAYANDSIARDLVAWISANEGDLDPFYKAGKKFIAKGTYDKGRATKLFLNAVNHYYKEYAKDNGIPASDVSAPTRKLAATKLREHFEYETGYRGNPGINGNGWTPIHAIRFNEDGSVSLMGAHTNPAKLGTGARFKALTSELAAKGARSPKALAAWIGRKKYGAKKFAQLSARGKRRRSR